MTTTQCDSIRQFCKDAGFSVRKFYDLEAKGEAPPTVRIGKRRLVKRDTGAAWLKAREK